MPTLPWLAVDPPAPDTEAVVMASVFRVRGYRHVLPFFLAAMRVHAQVRRADGALGVSLVAHPLRKEFRTLSAWRDRAALDALVRAEPHRSVMVAQKQAMADSTFTFWTVPAGDLPLSWDDANARLSRER